MYSWTSDTHARHVLFASAFLFLSRLKCLCVWGLLINKNTSLRVARFIVQPNKKFFFLYLSLCILTANKQTLVLLSLHLLCVTHRNMLLWTFCVKLPCWNLGIGLLKRTGYFSFSGYFLMYFPVRHQKCNQRCHCFGALIVVSLSEANLFTWSLWRWYPSFPHTPTQFHLRSKNH